MYKIGKSERRHRELVLGSHMQRLPTRHEHLELWTVGEQVRHLDSSAHHLLEVVQEQQDLLLAELFLETFQQRLTSHLRNAQHLSDGGHNQSGVAQGSQVYKNHPVCEAVREFRGQLQAQTRFAHAAWAGQGHKAYILALHEMSDGS